jgi:predicted ATPase
MSESTYQLASLREQSDRFVVLSGCSGGGKSTLLTALERRGFIVFEEPGRQIVKEQQFLTGNALPWTDPLQFVELSVSRSIHQMALAARGDQRSFLDRGIVDAISFLEHLCLPVPLHLENAVKQLRYHRRVFIAPPWPEIFAADAERRHSFDEAKAQYSSLLRTYERLGYSLVELPKIDVESRVEFVVGQLAESGS